MKKATTGALVLAAALVFLGVSAASAANPGNPATLNTQATVEILKPISITQTAFLSFGKIVGPIGASASNTYTSGGSIGGTGGGSVVSAGTGHAFQVAGSPEPAFWTLAPTGACSDAKVVLLAPNLVDRPITTTNFSLSGGGTIEITNAADGTGPLGVVTCPYAFSVRYQ